MRLMKSVVLAALILIGTVGCRQEVSPPARLAILTPSRDSALTAGEPISLTFNLPLPDVLDLKLRPDAHFAISLSEDSSVLVISPLEAWAYDTEYSLEVEGLRYEFAIGPEPRVSVFVGGDILLDKRPGEQIEQHGPDVVFHGLREVLDTADIRFANLENPLSSRGAPVQKNFRFRSPPTTVNALSAAGFDVLSFTNNHTFDFGEEAVLDTMEHLEQAGIEYVGVGHHRAEAKAPVVLERNGVKVAFLAYMQKTILPAWSPPLWEADDNKPGVIFLDGEQGKETILAAVREAKLVSDVVLVSLHWGVEGTRAP
ncbi:MAG TPA: CapA family protein, partial [Bacillota bacterium]|nr:CapA family protein [Bacillota bacterium]